MNCCVDGNERIRPLGPYGRSATRRLEALDAQAVDYSRSTRNRLYALVERLGL